MTPFPQVVIPFVLLLVKAQMEFTRYMAPSKYRRVDWLGPDCSDCDFKELFRFFKADVVELANELRIPQEMDLPKGGKRSGMVCFLYVLWRTAYPGTLLRDCYEWGESRGTLCEMYSVMVTWLYITYADDLMNNLQVPAVRRKCAMFAAAITAKGAALPLIWGFIDGTYNHILVKPFLLGHTPLRMQLSSLSYAFVFIATCPKSVL
jgi:hypothetical protein